MDTFRWTVQTERAAQLLADGKLTLGEIAEELDIDPKTLWNWRKESEFAARVEELLEAFRQEVRRRGIAVRERRLQVLDDTWDRLQRVIQERADDPTHANVPGWKTGLLVHNVKSVGGGDNATVVDLYEIDTGLLRELREHKKQAAQELGQWTEKHEVEQTTKAYITVGPDDL